MMTKEQLLDIIQKAPYFDDSTKQTWTRRINTEGLTEKLLDELEGTIQSVIDTLFEETGAGKVNESDPADVKSYEEMVDGISQARDQYEKEMMKVQVMMSKTQNDAAKKIDIAVAQATSQAIKDNG